MARFVSSSLKLKDNQRVYWGDGDDASILWNGSDLILDSTVQGVAPTADTHLATKLYVDTEITTLSGLYDQHNELNDMDGGTPGEYYHLTSAQHTDLTDGGDATVHNHDHNALTNYDSAEHVTQHGRSAVSSGVSSHQVSITAMGDTNYTVNCTLQNTTDSPASIYAFLVTAKASDSFTVSFMGDIDSANYSLEWMVVDD